MGSDDADEPCCVAMVCDFFWPKLGGVEMHIWSLSQCLIRSGVRVVVITHEYAGEGGSRRTGVRTMTNGLKVYYVPWLTFHEDNSFPTLYPLLPLFRDILIRESVTVVHGHQATSSMMHECLLHARVMGYRTVYTDHSLFGFADVASVNLNKVLQFTLLGVDKAIAVSRTCRENLVLRAHIEPDRVISIPNAVDFSKFQPRATRVNSTSSRVTVVVISRLAYRKGIDLIAEAIPLACERNPNVDFIIGGDGPKRYLLHEMMKRCSLSHRVEILGSVAHEDVPSVLRRGSVFLNCSLTESFCIAILEAASCGLFVVSTRVGGVPEVLPPDMIEFSDAASAEGIVQALERALVHSAASDPQSFHNRVKSMYSWRDVAARTRKIYEQVTSKASPPATLTGTLYRYSLLGGFSGFIAICVVALDIVWLRIVSWWRPARNIEKMPWTHSYFPPAASRGCQ